MFSTWRSLALLLALTAGLCLTAPAHACPGCAETVAQAKADAAAGYNYSILYMMGSIYVVVGGLGAMGVYYARKHAPKINRI